MRLYAKLFLFGCSCALGATLTLAGWFIFTPAGAKTALKFLLRSRGMNNLVIGRVDGSLASGAVFEQVICYGKFPSLGYGRVNVARLRVTPDGFLSWEAGITNGVISCRAIEPVIFSGALTSSGFDLDFYTNRLAVDRFFELFFPSSPFVHKLTGHVDSINLHMRGKLLTPVFSGRVTVGELVYNNFRAENCPARFLFTVKDFPDHPRVYGAITFTSGTLRGPKTASVALRESSIFYHGDYTLPRYALNGSARVGSVNIDITLRGVKDKPELKFSSQPPLGQNELLVTVLTNRNFTFADDRLSDAALTAQLAAEAIDYFLFGNAGKKLKDTLGLGVSFDVDAAQHGVTVTEDLGKKVTAGYSLRQKEIPSLVQGTTHGAQTTQAVSGEYKLTDSLLFEAEREVGAHGNATQTPRESIMLKYKKDF